MTTPTVQVNVSGARGESFADVARRLGSIAGIPVAADDTDQDVLDAMAASVALTGPNIYASTAAGLAAVGEGEGFWVADGSGLALYRDVAGVATAVNPAFSASLVGVDQTTLGALITVANPGAANLIMSTDGAAGQSLTPGAASGDHNGDSNVVIVTEGFDDATTPFACVIVGAGAGGAALTIDSEVYIGYQAGQLKESGFACVLIGPDAGTNLRDNDLVIAIGRHTVADTSGATINTCTKAVWIGPESCQFAPDGDDMVGIGWNVQGTVSAAGSGRSVLAGSSVAQFATALRSVMLGFESGNEGTAFTDVVTAGNRSLHGVDGATNGVAIGGLTGYQDPGDSGTNPAAFVYLGDSAGMYISGSNNLVGGAYAGRRNNKQAISNLVLLGYRVGDETGADWTPVNYDFAIGYGPTAAERVIYGNMSTGVVNTKAQLNANGPVKAKVYTVATLPSASAAGAGARAGVTDANATTFASTVAGGGANKVPVYSDGTNWIIG